MDLFCVLLVVLVFWYTFVVSNFFLRAPKIESDFDALRKLSLLIININTTICTTTSSTTTNIVNIDIGVLFDFTYI